MLAGIEDVKSVGSLWFQPGPLAVSCMTMTLHAIEAAQGVSSCALADVLREMPDINFFVIAGNFWYESVLVDNGNAFFSQYHANFLAGPVRWYECGTSTGEPRQIIKANGLPRRARPLDRKFLENGLNLWRT